MGCELAFVGRVVLAAMTVGSSGNASEVILRHRFAASVPFGTAHGEPPERPTAGVLKFRQPRHSV